MDKQKILQVLSDQKDEMKARDMSILCGRREERQLTLNSKLAQVVIGVRRSGKSTLCEKFLKQNDVNFAYVNFDDDRLADLATKDFDDVLDSLYQLYGDFSHLFVDEIQNIDGWPLFVNRLLRQGLHIFVTGSNSKLLSNELTTHLTGRYMRTELYPFSFAEYAAMRKVDLESVSVKAVALRKRELQEYLLQGGFPELLNGVANRRGYVDTLLNAIIKKDIAQRFKVRHVEALRRMANSLIENYCQEFKATVVGPKFGISDHTAENYYSYLKEAFLLLGVPKFSHKVVERVRNEKVYVVDIALATDRTGNFSPENLGWRLENTIYIELLRRARPTYSDVYYYRESTWEVDFVVAHAGVVDQLIQVSYDISNEKTLARELRGLINGAKKLKCNNLLLINLSEEGDVTVDDLTIHKVMASEWLAQPLPNE